MRRIAVSLLLLSGCASVVPLTPQGAKVREIAVAATSACEPLGIAEYNDTIMKMGKTPSLVHANGENGLRNAVGEKGGNAFVPQRSDADFFWGHVTYSGDAFKCP